MKASSRHLQLLCGYVGAYPKSGQDWALNLLAGLDCNPIYILLEVSPVECNKPYFRVDVHRVVPLVCCSEIILT